jgi:hypothetical protein
MNWLKNIFSGGQMSGSQNRKAVYTIILGNYDDLKEPEIVSQDYDYICFTDQKGLRSKTWKIVRVNCHKFSNTKRCAGYLIVYPFDYLARYELSVLVSGVISIHCDVGEFVNRVLPLDKSIAVMTNPKSDCVYFASENVIRSKKDKEEIVLGQMEKYRSEGYPEHNGMISTGVMIRRHNDENLKKHCRLWLDEMNEHSQRDQLSFNYILWKYKLIEPTYFSHEVRGNEFIIHKHRYTQRF